jgi:hypothetical protein
MTTSASWSRISAITRSRRAAGRTPLDRHDWTCRYTRAEHTHISGEEGRPHEGQGGLDNGSPVAVPAG